MTAHILVVDDEPDLEALILQKFRHQIREGTIAFLFARDGVDALKLGVARALGERPIPVESLAKSRCEIFTRQRKIDLNFGARRPDTSRECGRIGHLGDWRDARDRLLRELSERIRHRPDEAPVDIHGAAAHAGDDTGVGERAAFELGENQVAARADDITEHAENVDLEILELVALEHRPAGADHAGFQLIDGE